jgi:uncharacterized protein (DUF58 family)
MDEATPPSRARREELDGVIRGPPPRGDGRDWLSNSTGTPSMPPPLPSALDPAILNKITRLELRARTIVEGFLSGMHKSPYHGFSVEFAEHREYAPGDDLRHLDWKVYARSDRLYLKEYELETNLRAHVLLDVSESMDYRSGKLSKLDLASLLAASMTYLVLRQQDAVGLTCFSRDINLQLPPHSGMGALRPLLAAFASARPAQTTDLGAVLNRAADRIRHKSLVILVSDLLDKPEAILKGLGHLRHRRHDIIVFHVLDAYEVQFPFDRMTLFDGLEEMPKVICDPKPIRQAYLEELGKFLVEIRKGCLQLGIDYCRFTTDQSLDVALSEYLARRLGTV